MKKKFFLDLEIEEILFLVFSMKEKQKYQESLFLLLGIYFPNSLFKIWSSGRANLIKILDE